MEKKFNKNLIIHNNISFKYIKTKLKIQKRYSMSEFFDSIENKNKYKTPSKDNKDNQDMEKNEVNAFKTESKENFD